ncbi:MAG: HAD family hydrolase [Bacteroidetes bacterium]|nr:MAG: HAD family hydrolase [Bacteroidota bacterium]
MKKAVIFDMDGVIVNSEDLWQRAEKEVFSSLGVKMDEESCNLTMRMTTTEVTEFWFSKHPWQGKTFEDVEQMVISRVIELIENEQCGIVGIKEFIEELKSSGLKVGLATNSPYKIIPRVLSRLGIMSMFDAIASSEFEKKGKPEPDVYLTVSRKLDENVTECIAIEDSNSGILSAKKAGMTVFAFTNSGKNKNLKNADYVFHEYSELNMEMFIMN